MIMFSTTADQNKTIVKILDRAEEMFLWRSDNRLAHAMDLTAIHSNGCPLDFAALLASAPNNFIHDIDKIDRHFDRKTGKMLNQTILRCAVKGG